MAQVAQGADTRIAKYCFIKEVQGRWVDISYFFEKSSMQLPLLSQRL